MNHNCLPKVLTPGYLTLTRSILRQAVLSLVLKSLSNNFHTFFPFAHRLIFVSEQSETSEFISKL